MWRVARSAAVIVVLVGLAFLLALLLSDIPPEPRSPAPAESSAPRTETSTAPATGVQAEGTQELPGGPFSQPAESPESRGAPPGKAPSGLAETGSSRAPEETEPPDETERGAAPLGGGEQS